MAGQEQIKRDRRDDGPDDLPELGASAPAGQTHDVDDLLDEIDGSWVRRGVRRGFRQGGGDLATAVASRGYLTSVLRPSRLPAPPRVASGRAPSGASTTHHGTTGVTFGGVLMAGADGYMGIANREMEKVFFDEFSTVGIAGTAGLAILVRLFQVELGLRRSRR